MGQGPHEILLNECNRVFFTNSRISFKGFSEETRMPDTPDDRTLSASAAQVSFTSIGPYRLI